MTFGPKISRNLFSFTEKDDNSVEKKSAENKLQFYSAEKCLFPRQKRIISAEGILTNSAAFFLRFRGFCRKDKNVAANLEMGEKWHVRSS